MSDSNYNLNIPTYSSLINKINLFINTFGNIYFKRGLEITTGVKEHGHGYWRKGVYKNNIWRTFKFM